jgi:hypothetical protein
LPATRTFNAVSATLGEPITWISGNHKKQVAIWIPNTSTQDSFKELARETNWVNKVCKNMNRSADTNEEKDEAIGWLLEELMNKSPDAFHCVACKIGYIPADMSRMSATYTNAMLKESNNNAKQARIISRFLKYWYNRWLLASEFDVSSLSDGYVEPEEGYIIMDKEKIRYWWKHPGEVIVSEIGDMLKPEGLQDVKSFDIAIGGDHGKGRFRLALILIIRFHSVTEFLRRVFVHGEIDSAKDKASILHDTFLEKFDAEITKIVQHKKFWLYQSPSQKASVSFEQIEDGFAKPVRSFICGDGKFFMQVTGRENMASHWCPYCKTLVTRCEWKNEKDWINCNEEEWTLQGLKDQLEENIQKDLKGGARKGVVKKVIFNFAEPNHILPNILHQEINLVNDLMQHLYDYVEWAIECWEEEPKRIRDAYLQAHINVTNIGDEIDEQEQAISSYKAELSSKDISETEQGDLEDALQEAEEHVEKLKHLLPKAKKKLKDTRKTFQAMMSERKLNDIRLTLDNSILIDKFNFKRPAYHGGKFIGPHCRGMMERRDEFTKEIKDLFLSMVDPKDDEKKEKIKNFMDCTNRYLSVLSNIFSLARKFNGTMTEEDFCHMESSVKNSLKLQVSLG